MLLALALLIAPQEATALRDATVAGHGPIPSRSGVLHTLLRIDVVDAAGASHAIYRTYLGPEDVPRIGARCDIRFHLGSIGDGFIMDAENRRRGEVLDSISCR